MRSAESTTFGYFAIKMRIKSIRVRKDFKLPLPVPLEYGGKSRRTSYFLAPSVLFFNRRALLRHFRHLSAAMWFLAPHLKQILKKSLRCWAICFLVASVMGIHSLLKGGKISSFLSYPIIASNSSRAITAVTAVTPK